MKKIISLLIATSFIFQGCSMFQLVPTGDTKTLAVLAGIAAYEIGYSVAKTEDAEIDRGVRNIYSLAKTGELSQDGLNQITDLISKRVPDRPTLPHSIMSLLQLVGIQFNPQGEAIGLEEIPPEVFQAVESNYIAGFDLYQKIKTGQISEDDAESGLSMLRDYRKQLSQRKNHV